MVLQSWKTIIESSGKQGDLGRAKTIEFLAEAGQELERINLSNVVLRGLAIPDCVNLYWSDLTNASFATDAPSEKRAGFSTKLPKVKLRLSDLTDTNFRTPS